jgi:plasmid stabilization system protein ParE
MSGQRLFIWPEAEQDFAAASQWYESKTAGLGLDFAREIDIALQKVILKPDLFPILDKTLEVRRVLVSRFPYKIFFVVRPEQIEVCAILHSSRDDSIIKGRLE